MKSKVENLIDLLVNNQIREALFNFSNKRKIYFIKVETYFEKRCLYLFWRTMGLNVFEGLRENYKNTDLIDVIIESDKLIYVSYLLWHCLLSNIIRKNHSRSYNEFKELIKQDSDLYQELISIETKVESKVGSCF